MSEFPSGGFVFGETLQEPERTTQAIELLRTIMVILDAEKGQLISKAIEFRDKEPNPVDRGPLDGAYPEREFVNTLRSVRKILETPDGKNILTQANELMEELRQLREK